MITSRYKTDISPKAALELLKHRPNDVAGAVWRRLSVAAGP
jgi:hypothetical protein